MKAIVYSKEKNAAMIEKDQPELVQADDVVVKINYTGICGTDLRILMGKFIAQENVTLGHEAVGEVVQIGEGVRALGLGDRVIVDPTLFDGICDYCRKGSFHLCDHKAGSEVGVDRDGTFAQYTILPEKFLYKVPAEMTDERAVLVEPLACVLNNLEAGELKVDDSVVVLGGGPIGFLTALVASRSASKVILVERNPARIRFAKAHLEFVVDSREPHWIKEVLSLNGECKSSLVVDTTGVLLEEGLELVDKGGRVVIMGFDSDYEAKIKPLYLTNNAIRIIGAGDYNSMFPRAVKVAGNLDLESMITHRFSLDEYESAIGLLMSLNASSQMDGETEIMKVVFDLK